MASTRLSPSATRSALAALRADTFAPLARSRGGGCPRCHAAASCAPAPSVRFFASSSRARSSWPVGASDDAEDEHARAGPSSARAGASSSSSSSSTAAGPSSEHRTRAGPILERNPPATHEPTASTSTGASTSSSAASAMESVAQARRGATASMTDRALHVRDEALQLANQAVREVRRDGKTLRQLEGEAREAQRELVGIRSAFSSGAAPAGTGSGAAEAARDRAEEQQQQRAGSRVGGSSRSVAGKLPPAPRQKTIMYLDKMKEAGTPIAALTAYDYPTALSLRAADIDICLVGDSLANVALGFATTQGLRLDALIHHAQAVQRALRASTLLATAPPIPLVVADMPFGTFQTSIEEGVRAAVRLIQEGGVDAVKIEGGPEVVPLVQRLTSFGIPVMGHVGLQPQRVGATSGYRVQGRSAGAAHAIWASAKAIQDAGAFGIVLECVPSPLARVLTQRLHIPTIGIGAGPDCDGQILVTSDMLGELTSPAHVVAGLEGDHDVEEARQTLAAAAAANVSSVTPGAAAGLVPNNPDEDAAPGAMPHANSSPAQPTSAPADAASPAERGASLSHQPVPLPHPSTPNAPKFVRQFLRAGTTLGAIRMQAVRDYVRAVRERSFPAEGVETYGMKEQQLRSFLNAVHGESGSP